MSSLRPYIDKMQEFFFLQLVTVAGSSTYPQDNRERILLAAEALFASQGFSGTSVREIVGQAEVTAPVLYYYFGSKGELLLTLITERFERHILRIREGIEGVDDVEELIAKWNEAKMRVSSEHSTALRLVLGAVWGPDTPKLSSLVFRFSQETFQLFKTTLQTLDPSISDARAQYGYLMMDGLVNTLVFPLLRVNSSIDVQDVLDAITPRVVAILRDDFPLPERTLEQLKDNMMQQIQSSSDETSTQENA